MIDSIRRRAMLGFQQRRMAISVIRCQLDTSGNFPVETHSEHWLAIVKI
jgi:hypothetical protein